MNRILVTGGAGFIGSNFIRFLLKNTDCNVVSLDRLDEAANLARLHACVQGWPCRFTAVWHDLRSAINPVNVPGPFRYIVHMAAASHVDRSIKDPVGFVMDNVVGTVNLLEFARLHTSPEKVLYFSTDEVFGPAFGDTPFDEYAPHTPNNPYAASKAAAEALAPAYVNTYGLPLLVTHCTNVYGPGQYREKFIPMVIDKVRTGQVVQIHARDGVSSTRYYVHVDDVSSAVLAILERGGIIGGPSTGKYNISGPEEFSNLEVARRIARLLGRPLHYELVDFVPGRPRHDMRYAIRSTRLEALGWSPLVDFDRGLKELLRDGQPSQLFSRASP